MNTQILSTLFSNEFQSFIDSLEIDYSIENNRYIFKKLPGGQFLEIILVPLADSTSIPDPIPGYAPGTIYLYEDRWRGMNELVKARIKAHLGMGRRVFARNCTVEKITADTAKEFLERNHIYGYARSKYKYGLFHRGELMAAATFSSPRPMNRDGRILQSYEWVRYASLADLRVVGGMGKIMAHFVRELSPEEIMSYADKEWSQGETYLKLGFKRVGEIPPVEFLVDPHMYRRISAKKLESDRAYSGLFVNTDKDDLIPIHNLGSVKYLKTIL